MDGAFIDGNRGGWNSHVTGSCSAEKQAGWAAGLAQAVSDLAERIGPNKTLISNYPTPEALQYCVGGMMERGGSIDDIQAFGKRTCGPWKQPCLYVARSTQHAAHAARAARSTRSTRSTRQLVFFLVMCVFCFVFVLFLVVCGCEG